MLLSRSPAGGGGHRARIRNEGGRRGDDATASGRAGARARERGSEASVCGARRRRARHTLTASSATAASTPMHAWMIFMLFDNRSKKKSNFGISHTFVHQKKGHLNENDLRDPPETFKKQKGGHSRMLKLCCSSTLLRTLGAAAAVPAMASCFILSGGPPASGFGGRFALAFPSSRPFVTASQVRPPVQRVLRRM